MTLQKEQENSKIFNSSGAWTICISSTETELAVSFKVFTNIVHQNSAFFYARNRFNIKEIMACDKLLGNINPIGFILWLLFSPSSQYAEWDLNKRTH